jgi:hypothetical protein
MGHILAVTSKRPSKFHHTCNSDSLSPALYLEIEFCSRSCSSTTCLVLYREQRVGSYISVSYHVTQNKGHFSWYLNLKFTASVKDSDGKGSVWPGYSSHDKVHSSKNKIGHPFSPSPSFRIGKRRREEHRGGEREFSLLVWLVSRLFLGNDFQHEHSK